MAVPPNDEARLIERFGPHPQYEPPGGWQDESRRPAEKLVKTHCCFCGQQCGIQLKVRDNQVIGFEPWEEFPFNRGMLCPKGVKRYMQSGHPDRLLAPLIRESSGFREATWDEALNRVASRIREIQERHGRSPGVHRESGALVRHMRARIRASRARHRASIEGCRERAGVDQHLSGNGQYRARRCRLRDDYRSRQWAGRTRARPEV